MTFITKESPEKAGFILPIISMMFDSARGHTIAGTWQVENRSFAGSHERFRVHAIIKISGLNAWPS
jgi:hypothetical protein